MGIAAPLTKFGYNATDNVLLHDETEYSTSSTTYVLKRSIEQLESIAGSSYLRIKVDLGINDLSAETETFQLRYFDGSSETTLWTEAVTHVKYVTYENDVTASWTKQGILRFYIKISNATKTAYLDEIKICGERSPFAI